VRKGFASVLKRIADHVEKAFKFYAVDSKFSTFIKSLITRVLITPAPVAYGHNVLHLAAWNQDTECLNVLLKMLDLVQAMKVSNPNQIYFLVLFCNVYWHLFH
jgi:hypothetical protein